MSGLTAVVLGIIVGVVAFVPFVAISYRRRGRLSFGRFMLWAAALVYFWAIWTYTLLPLPDPAAMQCVGAITDPLELVRDVQKALGHPGNPITDPAILQILFNILLFVPLGFFIRVLGGRGIVVAVAVGLGISLLVETTQLTGVWGIYPCAYRFFDVGDLITNTTGALLGSVVALIVPRHLRGSEEAPDADRPRPVTRARRALAILCDLLGFWLISAAASVATQVVLIYVLHQQALADEGLIASLVGTGGTSALWLLVILARGGSVGDLAVRLRYDGGFVARLLRWLGGYAGIMALSLLPFVGEWYGILLLVNVVMFCTTKDGRGLPGVVSRSYLEDARTQRAPITSA